ncbi:MAG TPA: MgtC/SapB family protein [Spongiibacteraceae bacterium]|jgi:putative Mg2+ transporter-C (MgtC) family protein
MLDALAYNEQLDIALRLLAAAVGGAAIGLNRFLRHKSAGMRTHSLVALGAAMATLIGIEIGDSDAASRVMQGLVTGVGFIGAGVIMRDGESHVQGLTTAASIWVCSIIGIACGADKLILAASGVVLTLTLLVLGRPIERKIARIARDENAANDHSD